MKACPGSPARNGCNPAPATAQHGESAHDERDKPVQLTRLRDICCGDKLFEQELIEVFLADTLARIRKMETSLLEKNLEIFRTQIHSIKGASASAGAQTMTSIAMSLEDATAEGHGNGRACFRLLNELKREYEKVRTFLTDYVGMGLPDDDLPRADDPR